MLRFAAVLAALGWASAQSSVAADQQRNAVLDRSIAADAARYSELAMGIWDLAEMGYLEFESSEKLKDALEPRVSRSLQVLPVSLQRSPRPTVEVNL